MYPNRCFTCLRVLEWHVWFADPKMEPAERLEKLGYTRLCCRRMMLKGLDNSEEVLGLLNADRLITQKRKEGNITIHYRRWFPQVIVSAPPAVAVQPSATIEIPMTADRSYICE